MQPVSLRQSLRLPARCPSYRLVSKKHRRTRLCLSGPLDSARSAISGRSIPSTRGKPIQFVREENPRSGTVLEGKTHHGKKTQFRSECVSILFSDSARIGKGHRRGILESPWRCPALTISTSLRFVPAPLQTTASFPHSPPGTFGRNPHRSSIRDFDAFRAACRSWSKVTLR